MDYIAFRSEDAEEYGVHAAILLYGIRYWTEFNETHKHNRHKDEDGITRTWVYNSFKAWSMMYGFMSEDQIKRAVKRLRDGGAILVGNFNKNSYDRTQWYALTNKSIRQSTPIHSAKSPNGSGENHSPIPVITQSLTNEVPLESSQTVSDKIDTETRIELEPDVSLTEEEFATLSQKYGRSNVEKYAARLSAYQAEKNKLYKSAYRTLNNWLKKDDIAPPKPKTELNDPVSQMIDRKYYGRS